MKTRNNILIEECFNKGYRVDNNGNVYSNLNNKLSLIISDKIYYYFSFRLDSFRQKIPVHRLQAYQKYGEKIFEKNIVVRHLNNNRKDNSYDNIAIGTQSDNMMDMPKEQRILRSSHPIYNHKEIIEDRNKGLTYKELMKKYNISSKGTLSFIINKSLENINNEKKELINKEFNNGSTS